jgi:hypothetical protein
MWNYDIQLGYLILKNNKNVIFLSIRQKKGGYPYPTYIPKSDIPSTLVGS